MVLSPMHMNFWVFKVFFHKIYKIFVIRPNLFHNMYVSISIKSTFWFYSEIHRIYFEVKQIYIKLPTNLIILILAGFFVLHSSWKITKIEITLHQVKYKFPFLFYSLSKMPSGFCWEPIFYLCLWIYTSPRHLKKLPQLRGKTM